MTNERIRPFYCGTQGADWRTWNCENCKRAGSYTDETQREFRWNCDIERALDEAYFGDGSVSGEIAQRMGGYRSSAKSRWKVDKDKELARCLLEEAECASYLFDPQRLLEWCTRYGCTPEQARQGALYGVQDWITEWVLLRLDADVKE